jgi:O-acetyl-ADP-ribose deacetylase (regulator of RNase III)
VAFPAISTGVFGYPADAAAEIAVATTSAADDLDLDRVVLVAFDDATLGRYQALLG